MKPQVRSVLHAPSATFSHVVWDPESRHGAVIDPALDFDPKSGCTGTDTPTRLLAIVAREGLTIDWILETHAHADHITAAPWLQAHLGAPPVAIGEGIRGVQDRFRRLFNLDHGFVPDGRPFDRLFADGATFPIGGALEGRVIATPGHTSDHVTYVIGDAAFVGDTLFMPDAGTARCDFPGGDARRLFRSVQRLFDELGDTMRVFTLHDYGPGGREPANETTVDAQRSDNIHVRLGTNEREFVHMREERDATLELPTLIIPSIQVNIRAGHFPPAASNGITYLQIPVDAFA